MASPVVVGPAAGGTQITVVDAVAIGDDLNDRFEDGAQGFSAQPLYMLEADHRVANDFSRKYWIVTGNPDSGESQRILNETAHELRSGNTQYIILGHRSENILIDEVNIMFKQNYCSNANNEDISSAYHRSNARLYNYCG